MTWRTVTTTFQPVRRMAEKSGTCAICGKPAKRSTTFQQTINPWNRNADGDPKTVGEIGSELEAAVATWRAESVVHAKCEARS